MIRTFMNYILILFAMELIVQENMVNSSNNFEIFMDSEKQMIKSLRNYVKKEKERLEFLEIYWARLKLEYERAMKDVSYYLGNPINVFTLIKRMGVDLELAENVLKDKSGFNIPPTLILPKKEDLVNSALNLVKLQAEYHLNVTQLANGVLSATESQGKRTDGVTQLSSRECFMIGRILLKEKQDYKNAISWMEEAHRRIKEEDCEICPFNETEIVEHIGQTYYAMGDIKNAVAWTERRIALNPSDPKFQKYVNLLEKLKKRELKNSKETQKSISEPNGSVNKNKTKSSQCVENVGKAKVDPQEHNRKRLTCYFTNGLHQSLTLTRVKIETLNYNPNVLLVHDILSDTEIRALQELADQKLLSDHEINQSKHITLNTVYLEDASSEIVARISQRVVVLSGLTLENYEPLKMMHYDTKRQSLQLNDTIPKLLENINEGFQQNDSETDSMLFFLSDAQDSGAAIFQALKLTVVPVKGAALYWKNARVSWPELKGSNWVAIKKLKECTQNWCLVWTAEKVKTETNN